MLSKMHLRGSTPHMFETGSGIVLIPTLSRQLLFLPRNQADCETHRLPGMTVLMVLVVGACMRVHMIMRTLVHVVLLYHQPIFRIKWQGTKLTFLACTCM